MKKTSPWRRVLKLVLIALAAVIGIAGAYIAYLFIDYDRVGDAAVAVQEGTANIAHPQTEYSVLTYNIGFAAYTPDFSFFMDGGTQSRAASEQSVNSVMQGIAQLAREQDADILLFEEVDEHATRSHHVNERLILEEGFEEYDRMFAVNYNSSYLMYPFDEPHGASLSGLLTLSRFDVSDCRRVQLPVETGFNKFFDLDRCYSVARIPVSNQKELVVYTAHLSAYTSDGTIATTQLKLLLEDMLGEYKKGNYVLCGGDFNKDLLGSSSQYFGVTGEEYTWAQPFPTELLDGTGFSIAAPSAAPTCRNTDEPYHAGQFVLTVDGFIVSDNIEVLDVRVADDTFSYSDHNPVKLNFVLKE